MPYTNGGLCVKVNKVYHPDRLLYPMKRSGPKGSGQFERITWDEAIRNEFGPEAIDALQLPRHTGNHAGAQRR